MAQERLLGGKTCTLLLFQKVKGKSKYKTKKAAVWWFPFKLRLNLVKSTNCTIVILILNILFAK